MDFLRTLLIYMSATLALSVQTTSTPGPTPEPTPGAVTTAVVSMDLSTQLIPAGPTETPSPEPTVSVTPVPVPTITPNRAYHNLAMGAKGNEVRALQEKLIELGYLPAGAADGAYGRQTYNAVRRFQYYNGLSQDGVAGRSTQTNLFENPDIMPYPNASSGEGTEDGGTPAPEEQDLQETPEPLEPGAENMTAVPPEMVQLRTLAPDEAAAQEAAEPSNETDEAATEEPAEGTEAPGETAEATTEEPAEDVTGEPEETAAATTEAPAEETEAPGEPAEATTEEPAEDVTEEPEEEPQEITEDVLLEDEEYDEIQGSISLNDSGSPLEWINTEDGVPVTRMPRLQKKSGSIRVSLDDLAACLEGWNLTDNVNTIVLEAEGYTIAFYNEEAGISATRDGLDMEVDPDKVSIIGEGHFIDAAYLAELLNGTAEWDEEESTLMLRIPSKEALSATD